jgi:hypothetical protein
VVLVLMVRPLSTRPHNEEALTDTRFTHCSGSYFVNLPRRRRSRSLLVRL